jgi:hypothetical protein
MATILKARGPMTKDLVEPVAGNGTTWIGASSVTMVEEA